VLLWDRGGTSMISASIAPSSLALTAQGASTPPRAMRPAEPREANPSDARLTAAANWNETGQYRGKAPRVNPSDEKDDLYW
jgi:hypothetical protein